MTDKKNVNEFLENLSNLESEAKEKEMEKMIESMKEKADFYDAVASLDGLMSFEEVAEELACGLKANGIMAILRDAKALDKNKHPYQKHVNAGHFVLRLGCEEVDGEVVTKLTTYVKPKGLNYTRKIVKKYLND